MVTKRPNPSLTGPAHAGRSGRPWKRLVAEVRARGDKCGICGQTIDYNLPRTDPKSFTVDHIRSWSGHPELRTDPGNLRAAHRDCNSSKGAGADLPSLGLRSRNW